MQTSLGVRVGVDKRGAEKESRIPVTTYNFQMPLMHMPSELLQVHQFQPTQATSSTVSPVRRQPNAVSSDFLTP